MSSASSKITRSPDHGEAVGRVMGGIYKLVSCPLTSSLLSQNFSLLLQNQRVRVPCGVPSPKNLLSPADVRDAAESNEAQYHVKHVYQNYDRTRVCVL